jgi:hypothetical protein
VVDVERLPHAAVHLLQTSGTHIFSFFCGLKGMMPNIQEMLQWVAKVRITSRAGSHMCISRSHKVAYLVLKHTVFCCHRRRACTGVVSLPSADKEE